MTISIIVAMDRNRLIGSNNSLPWHIPADLKYFREKTLNNTIVMGSKTYHSIGKPLPGRNNLVLTKNLHLQVELLNEYRTLVADDVDNLFQIYMNSTDEYFIVGGAEVYAQLLPHADKLYITHINHEFEGDTYFPEYDESNFEIESSYGLSKDSANPFDLIFAVYKRKMKY